MHAGQARAALAASASVKTLVSAGVVLSGRRTGEPCHGWVARPMPVGMHHLKLKLTLPAALTLCTKDCVDLKTNSTHCGDCKTRCPPGSTCVAGACKAPTAAAAAKPATVAKPTVAAAKPSAKTAMPTTVAAPAKLTCTARKFGELHTTYPGQSLIECHERLQHSRHAETSVSI